MLCSRVGCDGLTREDSDFTRDALAYNLPQRRYICVYGHSVYEGVPPPDLRPRIVTQRPAPGRLHARVCWWCQEPFEGKALQKYCSLDCSHAIDAERTRLRNAKDRSTLSPAELQRLRAIPFGRYVKAPKVRVPYAPRPANLSRAWV